MLFFITYKVTFDILFFSQPFFKFIFVTFYSQSEMYLKYGTLTVQIK